MTKAQFLKKRLNHLYRQKYFGFQYEDPLSVEFTDNDHLPTNYEALKSTVLNCHLCPLAKQRKNVVFGEGNENAELMIVGEGPGAMEDETGRPFVGRAGELLTAMIEKAILLKRSEVYIANIVKCRPPNNRAPEIDEANACKPYLMQQIELIKPKVIFALGGTAYKYLMNDEQGISKVRGKLFELNGVKVIPSFHPSFLLRNPSAKKEAFADCLKVKEML